MINVERCFERIASLLYGTVRDGACVPLSCGSRRVARVRELFDVAHQAKQQPLAVDSCAAAQREAIQPFKERDVADHGLGRTQTLVAQRTRRASAWRAAKVFADMAIRHVARPFPIQRLPRRTHTGARVGIIREITRRKHRRQRLRVARLVVQQIRRTRVVLAVRKSFIAPAGGRQGVAASTMQRINGTTGTQIVIGAHASSMSIVNDAAECDEVVQIINASGANTLVIGLGTPKQEIWVDPFRAHMPAVVFWSEVAHARIADVARLRLFFRLFEEARRAPGVAL